MKKFISVLLTLTLAFGCCTPCFAAEDEVPQPPAGTKNCEYPIVLVRGMIFAGLTEDMGTDTEQPAVKPVKVFDVIKTVFQFAVSSLLSFSLSKGIEKIIDYVRTVIGSLACDENGDSRYNVTCETYDGSVANYPSLYDTQGANAEYGMVKTLAETYGAENVYFYVYDWRLDPYDNADKMDEVINTALLDHPGADKVDIVCCSMGGMQTSVYMAKYGYSRIHKILFMSAAFMGAEVASDLLCGKLTVTGETLAAYCSYAVKDKPVLPLLVSAATKIGIFKIAAAAVSMFINKFADKVYADLMLDIFGTMPGIWSLVLPEDYDACMEYMFRDDEMREKYAGVIERAQRLHEYALDREYMLRQAQYDGVYIAVVANYDIPLTPVYERAVANGDGILETEVMSGFATLAPYGKTLEDVQADRYISPDLVIDASGCLFPDQTWFIKGAPHVSGSDGTDYVDFLVWLIDCDGQPTIDSSSDYPQFMLSDKNETLASAV